MKAKVTAIILAAAFILTMTGCGKTDAPSEGSAVSTESLTEVSEPTSEDLSFLDGEVVGSIIVLNDGRGLLLYSGSYENGREYAATLGEYKQRLGENVNVYSLVIPTSSAFYMPEKYYDEGVSARERPHIEDINANLSGVIPIDVYSALESHALNGEEQIYYKTDYHWSQLGAYYAAEKFAETALVPFDGLSDSEKYDKKERSSFTGNLTALINDSHTRARSEPFTWYEPKREVTTTTLDGREISYFQSPSTITDGDFYMVFLNGARTHTSTGLETGRRLMIVGDSFAWAFAPWLFGSFDDVWLIDCRGFEASVVELAKDKGITDLLFCTSIDIATTDTQKAIAEIM
ncbi:MAG: hypothetical protein K2J77_12320 [Oscillospiraceae bacterium]|nr:hypothetical protein [Oscillospiraceae bacterium]